MNYFDKIKNEMLDEEKRRGLRRQVVVDSTALRQFLDDYERMDSFKRSESDMHASLRHKLYNVLRALYSENHDSERLMLLIMEILKPMIEERIKAVTIDRVFDR